MHFHVPPVCDWKHLHPVRHLKAWFGTGTGFQRGSELLCLCPARPGSARPRTEVPPFVALLAAQLHFGMRR